MVRKKIPELVYLFLHLNLKVLFIIYVVYECNCSYMCKATTVCVYVCGDRQRFIFSVFFNCFYFETEPMI